MRRPLLILAVLLLAVPAQAANYYWVEDNGAPHWSLTSGGGPVETLASKFITTRDEVTLDEHSVNPVTRVGCLDDSAFVGDVHEGLILVCIGSLLILLWVGIKCVRRHPFTTAVVLVCILSVSTGAATKYWVQGSGNWNAKTDGTHYDHWSDNSGNVPDSLATALPTSTDGVVFDALSDSGGDFTVTINAAADCATMDWSTVDVVPTLAMSSTLAATGDVTFAAGMTVSGAGAMTLSGDLTLGAKMVLSYTGNITFAGSSAQVVTSNAIEIKSNIVLNAGATLQQVDAFVESGDGKAIIVPDRATWDSNGQSFQIKVGIGHSILNGNFIGGSALDAVTFTGANDAAGYGVLLGGNLTVQGNFEGHGNAVNKRLLIGSYPAGSGPRGIMVNGAIEAGDITNTDFENIHVAPYSAGHVVVLLGDSITANMGTNGVGSATLNALLVKQAGGDYGLINKGISGDHVHQMSDRFATDVAAVPGVSHVVVLGGINDIMDGDTEANIKTNLQAIYDAAQTAGIKVVAVSILPFGDHANWTSGRQTILKNVNDWMATNEAVDFYVAAYDTFEDPDDQYAILPGYNNDDLHLNAAGSAQLAQMEFDAVTWTNATTTPDLWDLSDADGSDGYTGDCGGNARITFTSPLTCYLVHPGAGTEYWITATNWKQLGGAAARMPLPQDPVIMNAASFAGAGRTFVANAGRLGASIDMSAIDPADAPTLNFGSSANTIYGSLIMPALGAATLSSTASTALTFAGKGDYTFTTATTDDGTGYTWNRAIWVSAYDGTLTITGQLRQGATNSLTLYQGTVNYSCQKIQMFENTKFVVQGGVLNLLNDTLYRSAPAAGVLVNSNGGGVINLKNCIIANSNDTWSLTTGATGGGTINLLTNCYYNSSNEGGTGSLYSTDAGYVKFVTEFTDLHLDPESPCVGKGTDLGNGALFVDIDGENPDTVGWSIGADAVADTDIVPVWWLNRRTQQ